MQPDAVIATDVCLSMRSVVCVSVCLSVYLCVYLVVTIVGLAQKI